MRLALLLCLTVLAAAAAADATDPRPRLREMAEQAQRERIAVALAWLKGCDLTPPPAVELPADPRDSDRAAKKAADEAREKLKAAELVLSRALEKPEDAAAQREVLGLVEGGLRGSFVDFYARLRAPESARPATAKAGGPRLGD